MLQLSSSVHFKKESMYQLSCTTTQAALPTPTAPVTNPENIFVQAHPDNTQEIIIGKTGVTVSGSAGGYILPAGANMNLPSNEWASYFAIAASGTQLLQVTYHASPY
jgi:hypothetical protein